MSAINAKAARERMRIMQDGLINCSGSILSGALSVVLVPVMIHRLGAESYGVLLTAQVMMSTAAAVDFGLDWSVTREVAVADTGTTGRESDDFVRSARTAYMLFAIVVALLIGLAGQWGARMLHVSPGTAANVQRVFVLAGLTFIGDRVAALSIAVLTGVRRFKLVNALTVASGVLRTAGILAILWESRSITVIALWQLAVSVLAAVVATAILYHESSRFRLRFGRVDWAALRRYASSSISAAMALGLAGIYWQLPHLLVVSTRGASELAMYSIAVRFPLVIVLLAARIALALFPAAAQHSQTNDVALLRTVLDAGTRAVVVIAMPLCTVLYIIAPALLETWTQSTDPAMVLILRLSAITVFIDCLASGAAEILWGVGVPKRVLVALLGATALNAVVGTVLITRVGIAGAAISMLVTVLFNTTALLMLAVPWCGISVIRLLSTVLRGVLIPAAACALVAWTLLRASTQAGWASLIGMSAVAGVTFFATLFITGARPEERKFAREILDAVRVGNNP